MGFAMAGGALLSGSAIILFLGGFMTTGAANILNQVLERDFDVLMHRTQMRPLADKRWKASSAVLLAGLLLLAGITLLGMFNPATALIGTISTILYAFVYTPMKRFSPVAVFIGAIPGALPVLIGWLAATGSISLEALLLFGVLFFWQFPHFWAIAWLSFEDYARGGFYLLPTREQDSTSAFHVFAWGLPLIPISLAFGYFYCTGWGGALLAAVFSLVYIVLAFRFWRLQTRKSALAVMFASFAHLPLVYIVLLLDNVI